MGIKLQLFASGLVLGLGSIFLSFSEAKEIARVNQSSITEHDLLLSLGGLNEGQRLSLLKDSSLRQRILLQAINQELLSQEAEKLKLDEDREFREALKIQRKVLLINALMEKKISPKVTDSEARKYYQNNQNLFSTNLIRIQQILLSTEAEAKDVLAKAKQSNADFQELAEAYSKDPTARTNRGEVGFITSAQVDPTIWNVANQTSVGTISEPIKNIAGYHIIKVLEKKDGKPLEFDEVELRVRSSLRDQLMANYLSGLRKNAKINVDQAYVGQQ